MIDYKNNCDIKIAVIGGDSRQLVAAKELAETGFEVAVYGFDTYEGEIKNIKQCVSLYDAISGSAITVLPLPFSNDGLNVNSPFGSESIPLSALWEAFRPGQLAAAGRISGDARLAASAAGIPLIDYYEREELNVLNAVPTAEGALEIAMNELPITIHGSKALVLGFGRIAKILAHSLKALGSEVSAAARKESDLAWMRVYGYKAVNLSALNSAVPEADVIFNTIPAAVLTTSVLQNIRRDTLIIDLASKPGGVDFKSAKEYNLKVIWALSLPGKAAPVTSGRIIKECILNILREKGIMSPC